MDFMFIFFCVYGGICGVIGAIYYYFAFGVAKLNWELEEARKKIAAMEAKKDTAQKLTHGG